MLRSLPSINMLGDNCCGCGACAAKCPQKCLEMHPDSCGFTHPSINVERCIGCGMCDAVCPVINVPEQDMCSLAMWAKTIDVALLDRSSSGGIFGLLAQNTLTQEGVVVGAAWTNGCRGLRHVLVESKEHLDSIMRSKYVQSSVGGEIYKGVRDALSHGRKVLFCGTACQVAGMRSYLGKLADSDLFLSVDVICHGVPSPELWRRWLEHIEIREGSSVRNVNFRSKITGWLSYSVMYEYITEKDNTLIFSSTEFTKDWYMRAFLKNASLRPSCFACPFKRSCGSDITLGDFWGIGQQHPDAPIEGGVSAVLGNTSKGIRAIDLPCSSLLHGESSPDKVVVENPALVRPPKPHPEYDAFLRSVSDGAPIPEMVKRWNLKLEPKPNLTQMAKRFVKKLIPET